MFWLTNSARANPLAAQQNQPLHYQDQHQHQQSYQLPSPCCTPTTTVTSQVHPHILTLAPTLTRSTWRDLKHELRAEKRAAKAEIRSHKHEYRDLPKRERKAARRAVKAQVWADVLSRHLGQRQRQDGALREEGQASGGQGPSFQTLRTEGRQVYTPPAGPPPRYDEAVDRGVSDVKA